MAIRWQVTIIALAKPAVVFVENGVDKLVVKRETYQDVVRNDLSYE